MRTTSLLTNGQPVILLSSTYRRYRPAKLRKENSLALSRAQKSQPNEIRFVFASADVQVPRQECTEQSNCERGKYIGQVVMGKPRRYYNTADISMMYYYLSFLTQDICKLHLCYDNLTDAPRHQRIRYVSMLL